MWNKCLIVTWVVVVVVVVVVVILAVVVVNCSTFRFCTIQ